jgi:hypothetical protein
VSPEVKGSNNDYDVRTTLTQHTGTTAGVSGLFLSSTFAGSPAVYVGIYTLPSSAQYYTSSADGKSCILGSLPDTSTFVFYTGNNPPTNFRDKDSQVCADDTIFGAYPIFHAITPTLVNNKVMIRITEGKSNDGLKRYLTAYYCNSGDSCDATGSNFSQINTLMEEPAGLNNVFPGL